MGSSLLLEGTVVVDLTSFLSGPFCSMLLADMGAEVIKVEPPGGDSSRQIPPHFVDGDSVYFHTINRNKRSVTLDLKTDEGKEGLWRLLERGDVLVENFRPGVISRLGFDLTEMRKRRPELITASISGFGNGSPHANVPAYDAVIQAWSGGMSITGTPGGPPVRMGIPIGDLAAGMYAALGISGAVARRYRTGEGTHVEVAMFDAQIALLGYQAAYYLHSGEVPGPQGSGHVSIPTYRAFRCSDGDYVMVTANTESMWRGLCRALGLDDLPNDPRFSVNADRLAHAVELWQVLEPAFEAIPADAAVRRLRDAGVPAAPVNTVAEALADPQTSHRNMVVDLQSETGNKVAVPGNPIKSDAMRPESDFSFPPGLGADNIELLESDNGES